MEFQIIVSNQIEEWEPRREDTLEFLDEEMRKVEATLADLKRRKDNLLKQTLVKCGWCGAESEIGQLTYIQTHWYEHPYSCTGGDRWHPGEGQWKCACGKRNRLFNKPGIEKLKRLFANVEDVYERSY